MKVGYKIVKNKNLVNGLSMISQLGITMITPILICTFIGVFIDGWTQKSPLFTIIFILLGTAAAFRNLFYYTMKQARKNSRDKEESHHE